MNYKFKCSECGNDVIEEVLPGVTKYSNISSLQMIDGTIVCEYGKSSEEDGSFEDIHYQCSVCGEEVPVDDLIAIAKEATK